jgi:hypothetical protein
LYVGDFLDRRLKLQEGDDPPAFIRIGLLLLF